MAAIVPASVGAVIACTGGPGPLDDATEQDAEAYGRCRPGKPRNTEGCGNLPLAGDCSGLEDASVEQAICDELCGTPSSGREATTCSVAGGTVTCHCLVPGRRHARLDETSAPVATMPGAFLSRMAFFERASVDSFTLLARELRAHRAPPAFLRACDRARADEIRHARMAAKLARRYGGEVVLPLPPAIGPVRSLEEIAIENATEGCINETFNVLLALWQSEHAAAPELRRFFAAIAADEARHAALASRLDAWFRAELSPDAWARVEEARRRAIARLSTSLTEEPTAELSVLGLPHAAQAKALFARWIEASVLRAA